MVQIKGLNAVTINNVQDIQNVLKMGQKNRQVAETKANSYSSRSHAILEITITNEPKYYLDGATALKSTLQFVDLAGSESVDSTGTNRSRQQEGSNIKKSLVTLNKIINDRKSNSNPRYVSYRDSKLTRVLQSALSGDARVAIICCINPTQIEESKRTLDFALRARQVRTNANINQVALSVPASNRMELMEGAVDTEPKISNTNNELMNKIDALKVELADKDAEIKRLNDDLKSRNAGAFSIFHGANTGSKPNYDERWNKRLDDLREYKKQKGDCNVPQSQGPLGRWVQCQRYEYQRKIAGEQTPLTNERVAALESISFEWDGNKYDERWNKRLGELRKYKERNGHCYVPQSRGSLGKWVKNQRSHYRKREDGEQTSLTDDRVAALNEIGFQWKLN